jgi:hypothetical protein
MSSAYGTHEEGSSESRPVVGGSYVGCGGVSVWICLSPWPANTEAGLLTGGCDCLWRKVITLSCVPGLLKAMEVVALPYTAPLFRGSLEER